MSRSEGTLSHRVLPLSWTCVSLWSAAKCVGTLWGAPRSYLLQDQGSRAASWRVGARALPRTMDSSQGQEVASGLGEMPALSLGPDRKEHSWGMRAAATAGVQGVQSPPRGKEEQCGRWRPDGLGPLGQTHPMAGSERRAGALGVPWRTGGPPGLLLEGDRAGVAAVVSSQPELMGYPLWPRQCEARCAGGGEWEEVLSQHWCGEVQRPRGPKSPGVLGCGCGGADVRSCLVGHGGCDRPAIPLGVGHGRSWCCHGALGCQFSPGRAALGQRVGLPPGLPPSSWPCPSGQKASSVGGSYCQAF